MRLEVSKRAGRDIGDAAEYYEGCSEGLGREFLEEFQSTCSQILDMPFGFRAMSSRVRRCMMTRFRHGIYYSVAGDVVYVLSVTHLHRHPDAWKKPE